MIHANSNQSDDKLPIEIISFLVFISLFLTFFTTTAHGQNWQKVQQIIGGEGHVDQGVLGFTFPRTDIDLQINGTAVAPDFAAKAWIGFWPLPDGRVQLMGDVAMPATKVADAQNELLNQGLEITALHNHLLGESPHMMFMHIRGTAQTGEALARKVKLVLEAAHVPLEKESGESEEKEEMETGADWSAITNALGQPEEQEGDVIEYAFTRADLITINGVKLPFTEALESNPEVSFQMLKNGQVITTGEIFIRASEINPAAQALHQHGITVTALHNHMINTQPRMFWMHWVAKGESDRLAKGIRAALETLNLKPGSLPRQ